MGNRKSAIDFYNAGNQAVADKTQSSHLTVAYQLFASACVADPTWGTAHYQAANNNSDLDRIDAAVAGWRRALECEMPPEDKAKVLANLGWRLYSLGRSSEAFDRTIQSLDLDEKMFLSWVNLSLIYSEMDDDNQAIQAARKAYALEPTNADTNIALAFALLFGGQYAEGLKYFEERFRWRLHNYLHFPYPKWLGEEGKTVFLAADQGLGDTLSFARFVERASKRAQYIHACVQPELLRLFQYAFVHLPNVNIIPMGSPFPQADAWTTFVSLPFALGLTDKEIIEQPHIKQPNLALPDNWKTADRKLHIGIAWSGNPLSDVDRHRSMRIEQFLDLYKVPGIQLYSLQVGEHAKDVNERGCVALIRDLSPYIHDVCDTLGLLKHLDLVICCESALGHICGLAGKECWIPYTFSRQGRDYRAGSTGKKPLWYPKHRFFRQEVTGQWEPVFERICTALKDKMK